MKDSKIQWTDHTFNPWRGCTKVSDGCKHCYAEQQSLRNTKTLGVWGANGTRVVASDSMWREPLRWDKEARASGVRANHRHVGQPSPATNHRGGRNGRERTGRSVNA